ncbi:exosome complex protein Rrp42 [Candidatus Woesearchaeota archaeon]|nr:exosome complex protein Rrp42 [Candidatus Woesearchaeota archaeon]MBW3005307.1 exosome complex protein Rrp42 [Candidatus Woesearchaeota archaeon]
MAEKEHILKSLKAGVRYDGRKLLDYRKVSVEPNITCAEGSARVKIGETVVLVGVKLAVEEPYPDTPDQGKLMVNAELRPMASPKFESGPPGEQAIDIARVVDRGLRESKALAPEKLCIKAGEKVWSVMIDVCPLNDAGNMLDAASLGAVAALKSTRFPPVKEDGNIDWEAKLTDKKLELAKEPVEVTVLKIGEFYIVDPILEEEELADTSITIAVAEDGTVYAMQKRGDSPLSIDEIDKMVEIAVKKSAELRKFIR